MLGADTTLGSDRLRTLLMMVMRNVSTDSPGPIPNNPAPKYNDRARADCNLNIPLWQLVRASTAAPEYFPPEVVKDGTHEFVFVEILNIGMTGPRVMISPSAEAGDGLLDVVFLPAARKQEMIDWLRSDPDETPIPLTEIKAKKATLHWRQGPLRVDDEVFDAPEEEADVIVEIEPHGLHVCVPKIDT